jgi:hypothetical protein
MQHLGAAHRADDGVSGCRVEANDRFLLSVQVSQ